MKQPSGWKWLPLTFLAGLAGWFVDTVVPVVPYREIERINPFGPYSWPFELLPFCSLSIATLVAVLLIRPQPFWSIPLAFLGSIVITFLANHLLAVIPGLELIGVDALFLATLAMIGVASGFIIYQIISSLILKKRFKTPPALISAALGGSGLALSAHFSWLHPHDDFGFGFVVGFFLWTTLLSWASSIFLVAFLSYTRRLIAANKKAGL